MNSERKAHLLAALKKNCRYDGRKPFDYREITVEYGISRSAEGSARVKIGETEVIAGIKLETATPYPDRPNEGNLMVNAELLPMSNPEFEPGPPGDQATELARVVDRSIRESKSIDVKKLCISPGENAWGVMIDVCSINDAGNLFDAAALAALAALKDAKFPGLTKEGKANYEERTKNKLPLKREPLEVTVLKVGDQFFVDPLSDEEKVVEARLTVGVTEKDTVCALQKGGQSPLTLKDVDEMIKIAQKAAQKLRKAL
ncbi:RNA-binding protein [Candidatus Woesearchaeota archaeon CG10_big_fil_rev_8_21_14_0_10_37_12]|nr:MAG: RNA-binding protein [Candidatus Woesearchaeota archaeon CG10_big_fil_rev_8_21_14_0_10_37_12]